MQSGVHAACLLDGWCFSVLHCVPFAGSPWVPHTVTWTHGQVWGRSVPCHCSFPAPHLLAASLEAHLISSKSVLVKVS